MKNCLPTEDLSIDERGGKHLAFFTKFNMTPGNSRMLSEKIKIMLELLLLVLKRTRSSSILKLWSQNSPVCPAHHAVVHF
jgi:hypothetical protein